MTIQEIYQEYQIMPSLQLHMLRVAGVAYLLATNSLKDIDSSSVVLACLLHDMGNILKFDLQRFPSFVEPEGLEYWQTVKNEYRQRYGTTSPHTATVAICRELKMPARVIELIDSISFNQERNNYLSPDYEKKICAYADMRVAPHGVTSLNERLEDARIRYQPEDKNDTYHYVMAAYLRKIELQLNEVATMPLEEIIEESVSELFSELRAWELPEPQAVV